MQRREIEQRLGPYKAQQRVQFAWFRGPGLPDGGSEVSLAEETTLVEAPGDDFSLRLVNDHNQGFEMVSVKGEVFVKSLYGAFHKRRSDRTEPERVRSAAMAAGLGLEDIDWRRGEITVRGKGNRHDRLPLPADVGQRIENLAPLVDYLCPMTYPSSYHRGIPGYPNPVAHPYEVVFETVRSMRARVSHTHVQVRPWIQDFGFGSFPPYTADQIKQEMKALTDNGAQGWMIWNAVAQFTRDDWIARLEAVGVPCGILDQAAALLGRAGRAILLVVALGAG